MAVLEVDQIVVQHLDQQIISMTLETDPLDLRPERLQGGGQHE
jgi:hypothetical protein